MINGNNLGKTRGKQWFYFCGARVFVVSGRARIIGTVVPVHREPNDNSAGVNDQVVVCRCVAIVVGRMGTAPCHRVLQVCRNAPEESALCVLTCFSGRRVFLSRH